MSIDIYAGEAKILSSQTVGSNVIMNVETDYQMSERENLEEVRAHVLDSQIEYAIKYAGDGIVSKKKIELIGDAAIIHSQRFIASYASSIANSKITNEHTTASMQYIQDAEIIVDTNSLKKEFEREQKLDSLYKAYDNKNILVDKKNNEQKKDISFNEERAKNLAKFGRVLIDNSFFKCSVSATEQQGIQHKTTFICTYSPPKELIENYKLYFQTDFADIPMYKISKSGEDAENSTIGFFGELISSPFNSIASSIKAYNSNSSSSDVGFELISSQYEDYNKQFPAWVKSGQNINVNVYLFGFRSKLTFPIMKDEQIIKEVRFKLKYISTKEVLASDILNGMRVKEDIFMPIILKDNYSLFSSPK